MASDVHPPWPVVRDAVSRALAEDLLPLGDLSASLVPEDATATLELMVREEGVIAGQRCAEETFRQLDERLAVEWLLPDGSSVQSGDLVARFSGSLRPMLTAERTALNFLGRLSGIATLTRKFVDVAARESAAVRVLDTRKTTPGLRALEKAAVRAGGGHNHRGSLSDAVLVKDNHLVGVSITEAIVRARQMWPGRFVEIECDRIEQVEEACSAGASGILLDNMDPNQVAECVRLVAALNPHSPPLLEVSGGITLENVAEYAATGVDLISVGALTHSAPVLDLGLDG